ncbi:electron transport complex subunit RsxG [Pantoea sp. Aalb]|uniref:electron transport complex subunit RsxG n=1 Tax=Pantoea sp. Aalb TaxID=2576762 RepID=UPI001321E954|nr:electron transport complex subunit RsxG [Pantoea sp. Aalb]MXP67413.1 electron transport complex subunit RsxG [Pantoea sp. Aalb]
MIKKIYKNTLILCIFAIITSSITAIIYYITKPIINQQNTLEQKKIFDEIIPNNLYDNNLIQECYLLKNRSVFGNDIPHRFYLARKDNIPIAAVIESSTPDGYSGTIHMLISTDFQGQVFGVRVIEHHETPGLGDKIQLSISNWINNFKNKIVHGINDNDFAIKKDGGKFDQFTGATITPRAVVNAIKRTALFIKSLAMTDFSLLSTCK